MKMEKTLSDSDSEAERKIPSPALVPNEEPRFDNDDAVAYVAGILCYWQMTILYDGTVVHVGAPPMAFSRDMVANYLATHQYSHQDVLDEIHLYTVKHGYDHKFSAIKPAFRQVLKAKKKARFNDIMMPMLGNVGTSAELAALEWERVARLIEMPVHLSSAILKHYIWQIKQKCLGRPVVHHLMPIIYSPLQGSGKTTFVRRLLGPLKELASGDALLSDFADHRSIDIYSFLAVLIDDMDQIPEKFVPRLKSLITSVNINRRRLQTSNNDNVRQLSSLIGTANKAVHELVSDDTGHRRFAMLPFRNGDVAKGGDAEVWQIVSSLDYEAMWLSVDAFAPSPIREVLGDLHIHQNRSRPVSVHLIWLRNLDVNSEPVKAITTRAGVRADGLHELFMVQTGSQVSKRKFADDMTAALSEPDVPFDGKHKTQNGHFYRIKLPPAATTVPIPEPVPPSPEPAEA